MAKNTDVLIHMCNQVSGTETTEEWRKSAAGHLECAQIAVDAGVRKLVLSHITDSMDVPGIRERLIYEVSQIFSGEVVWAQDLMRLSIIRTLEPKHTG